MTIAPQQQYQHFATISRPQPIPAWLRVLLVALTVGGGFTGVAFTLQAMASPQMKGTALLVMCGVFVVLYLYVLIAGLLLVHNPARVMPLVPALMIQIPVLYSPLIAVRFAAGLNGSVGISENGFFWAMRLGADWQCNLFQAIPWGVGINVVPVILLVAIVWCSRRRHVPAAWDGAGMYRTS